MLAQLRIEKFTNHIRLIFAYTLPHEQRTVLDNPHALGGQNLLQL